MTNLAIEIGVQYQPDGRLSIFAKNTAAFIGKLLIVSDSGHNTAQQLSRAFCLLQHNLRRKREIGVDLPEPVLTGGLCSCLQLSLGRKNFLNAHLIDEVFATQVREVSAFLVICKV
jgi:hypothetical protein